MKKTLLAVAVVALLSTALLLVPACKDDETATPVADATTEDAGTGSDTVSADCSFGEAGCADDETDTYGVCVGGAVIQLEGGSFEMGGDDSRFPDAFPTHDVTVSSFGLGRTEVSNEQYAACVSCGVCTAPAQSGSYSGREPYLGNPDFDGHPVVFVSWEQAGTFCEGLGGRLPTEAEWEYAATGSEGRLYPWGELDPDFNLANYDYAFSDTSGVTEFAAGQTVDGVLNLAGNVWEWVADTYSESYYRQSPGNDPTGPEAGPIKVARGGSFGSDQYALRAYARTSFLETGTFSNVGFRCAFSD